MKGALCLVNDLQYNSESQGRTPNSSMHAYMQLFYNSLLQWYPRIFTKKVRTILLPPLTKIVTARVFAHSSITSMRSLVVPKDSSRTRPALPSFADVRSSKRGTMRPLVAMAINWFEIETRENVIQWHGSFGTRKNCVTNIMKEKQNAYLNLGPTHPSHRRQLVLHQ